jgi:Fe-S cluster biogenesis protein NfuA
MANAQTQSFQQRMGRIEQLLAELENGPDSPARAHARELVQILLDLHGDCLERLLGIAYEHGADGPGLIDKLTRDEAVTNLLLLHGLHPLDFETRVRQALERVRPILAMHGGSVELIAIGPERVVRLSLMGSCNGCPSSRQTLTSTIEEAVYAAAPETGGIEVEGVAAASAIGQEPAPTCGSPEFNGTREELRR